jgi:4-amino-4-deoxy-L-arabinose transferase-like glycosyltransferase
MLSTKSVRGSLVEHVLLVVLCFVILVFLYSSFGTVAYPYPVDYGEGPLLDNVRQLSQWQNIYQNSLEDPPYRVCNYPPFYLLLQVPFMKVFGPAFWYGRLVSFFGIIAAGLFLSLTLFSLTGDRVSSLLAGFLFFTHPYVTLWAPVFRVDSLALGLSWAALYLLVRRRASGRTMWAVVLLLTLSIYTKQSFLVAAPLAAFLWIAAFDSPRRALVFAASLAAAVTGLFILLNLVTDGGFLVHTVSANINEFRPGHALEFMTNMSRLLPVSLLFIACFLLCLPALPRKISLLPLVYLFGSLPSAAATGKIGSNINYFLEFAAAASLVTGAVFALKKRHRTALPKTFTAAGTRLLAVLVPALIFQVALSGYYAHREFRRRVGRNPEISLLAQSVKETEGRILMDNNLGLLPLSGRPIHFQPFEMSQLARSGHWDQSPLLEEIRRKEFAMILLTSPDSNDRSLRLTRWTGEMRKEIHAAYRRTDFISGLREGGVEVYRPIK